MVLKSVHSTHIAAVGHEGDKLQVKFKKGQTFEYSPVSKETYYELLEADSIGGYFHEHIKNNKEVNYVRID